MIIIGGDEDSRGIGVLRREVVRFRKVHAVHSGLFDDRLANAIRVGV